MRAGKGETAAADLAAHGRLGSEIEQPQPNATAKHPARRTSLPEPFVVGEFWANRRGQSVRVQLRQYEGRVIVDVRKFFTVDGRLQPTKKGVSLVIARLPELAAALNKAVANARELGLLGEGAAS